MRVFEADSRWAKKCVGYHIQARPDQATIDALLRVQCDVAAAFPSELHLVPPSAMHVTVVTLVAPQPISDVAEANWRKISAKMGKELVELACQKSPVSVVFPRVQFTTQAVLVATNAQPGLFAEIRTRFGTLLESLGLPTRRYDQTHVTIARFAKAGTVEQGVLEWIEQTHLELRGDFDAVRLIRELRYPSLEIEEI